MADEYPKALLELVADLQALPGIGRRTAERLAVALLDWNEQQLKDFGDRISRLKERIKSCTVCGNLAEGHQCRICLNANRDRTCICIVESSRQIPVIEKSGRFHGVYHVLGGRVSPLDGVDFEDLNVASLMNRVREQGVTEVIVSTSPDVEGEATANYLAEELGQAFDLTVTRIALGVPVGSDLTFADAATMAAAIDQRRPLGRPQAGVE